MLKNTLLVLAALCLFATPALAASGTTTFTYGPDANVLLLKTQVTDLDASGDCMSLTQDTTADITSQVCDIDLVNEIVWPKNAQVREIRVTTLVAGDAADNCEFNIEVAGTSIVAIENTLTTLVSTVETLEVAVNIADGALVGIMVEDGEGCADGTSPHLQVELWGSWVADGAF